MINGWFSKPVNVSNDLLLIDTLFIASDPPKPDSASTRTICVGLINLGIYIIVCFYIKFF